jgi:diguanylate cyclase (GGDEF)-like protein
VALYVADLRFFPLPVSVIFYPGHPPPVIVVGVMPLHTFKSLRAVGPAGAYFRPRVLQRFAILLALFLPLVWLLVAVVHGRLGSIAEQQNKRDLQNLAHAFSEEVRATVSTVDLSLIQLRSGWQRNRAEFPDIVGEVNQHLQGRVLLNITVTDARGILMYSSAARLAMGDAEHIRVHLDGSADQLFISRPIVGRISGLWTVQFTRPIRDREGRLVGVIGASVAPADFSRFYASIDLGEGASVGVVRHDGTVIARSTNGGDNRDMGRLLHGHPYTPDTALSGHFQRAGQLDGVERNYAWRTLPGYGLTVTVGQSVRDADMSYAEGYRLVTFAGVAVSLVLALLGWVVVAAADNRRLSIDALAAAEARWKLALNAAGAGVWDCDLATGIAALSPRAQAILQADDPTVPCAGGAPLARIHPDDLPGVQRALSDHFAGHTPDYAAEHRVRGRDGDWTWVLARGMLTQHTEAGRPQRMIGTFSNIDARKGEEEQIRHMAHHDALTGLPNRLLFDDRLAQALRAAERDGNKVAVIYFDLDKFKPVNDTHGHAVGDRLLQAVASRVRDGLRNSDTLARIGGDEFVVLLPECASAADAMTVSSTILALLYRPFEVSGLAFHISGSVGFALYPDGGADAEQLLRSADRAMYEAKARGRNQVAGCRQQLA